MWKCSRVWGMTPSVAAMTSRTASIPLTPGKMLQNITVLSVAALLGEAIRRIHTEASVSSLFV